MTSQFMLLEACRQDLNSLAFFFGTCGFFRNRFWGVCWEGEGRVAFQNDLLSKILTYPFRVPSRRKKSSITNHLLVDCNWEMLLLSKPQIFPGSFPTSQQEIIAEMKEPMNMPKAYVSALGSPENNKKMHLKLEVRKVLHHVITSFLKDDGVEDWKIRVWFAQMHQILESDQFCVGFRW